MKINQDYKYREIAGKYYLVPVAEAAEKSIIPMELTETAAWILTAISEGETKETIASEMTEVYEVNRETAESAVTQLLGALIRQGILMTKEDGTDDR